MSVLTAGLQIPSSIQAPLRLDFNLHALLVGVDLSPAPDEEPEEETVAASAVDAGPTYIPGKVSDLLAAGLLSPGAALEASRTSRETGETRTIRAEVQASGELYLVDTGRTYRSPSKAAQEGLEVVAANGWTTWRVAGTSTTLAYLRGRLNQAT